MRKKIIAYKGFNRDMKCRGMQYEEGKTYKMDKEPECCNEGYHCCENPLDCFNYYDPGEQSIYHKVEVLGKISTDDGSEDTKLATNEIKIGARLSFKELVDCTIDFVYKHCKKGGKGANKRTDNSIASNTGYRSVASNTGYRSVASNTGDSSVASNTGYRSVASNTGYSSVASNTGYSSVASNTGYRSVASNTGDSSVASNTGYRSVAKQLGEKGIASSLGIEGRASGKIGTWIVLAEWVNPKDSGWRSDYEVKEVKTVKVDGKKIKEDTLYILKDGKFVEVDKL